MVSNKSLSILLLFSIVLSLAGTLTVLNNMYNDGITGMAINASGLVNLSFADVISITTADANLINFGSCTTSNANLTIQSHAVTPNCTNYDTAGEITNISIRNDGNVHINVTLRASSIGQIHGGSFLAAPFGNNGSWIAYRSTNASRNGAYLGGCVTGAVATYTNITSNSTEFVVCNNLTSGTENSVVTDYQLFMVASVLPGTYSTNITFIATKKLS